MNPTLQTLTELRSTHGNFADRRIPEADLNTILETCVLAANASNKQSYSIILVEDQERMKELTPYVGSAALVFCVDFNRLQRTAQRLNLEYTVDRIMPFLTAYTDACLAAQTAAVAAQALGIDSLFTNGIHRGDPARVYRTLNLPTKGCFPVIELVLGYADAPAGEKRGRLRGDVIVHRETYSPLTDEAADDIIAKYDDPERNLASGANWQASHAHFLEWFFDVWVKRGPELEGRSPMFETLIASGLLDREL